jgi:hypothetical protein
MTYERTQDGNPHQLTILEHVFPARSIKRFANRQGEISVKYLSTGKIFRVKADDQIFCAKRVWDQRAEHGYMKNIEDAFQDIAERITNGGGSLLPGDSKVVTEFSGLCRLRAEWRDRRLGPQRILGIAGENLTKDQEEVLEKNHAVYVTAGGTTPGRYIAGIQIQIGIDRFSAELEGREWGIVTAQDSEYILPDNFGSFTIVPISPTISLIHDSQDLALSRNQVKMVNRCAAKIASQYVLARDFEACPE